MGIRGRAKSQSQFVCLRCGYGLNAAWNAAINLTTWAALTQPKVAALTEREL